MVTINLGTFAEEAESRGAVLASKKVRKGTSERARGNLDLITSHGGVVAASDLVIVTAGGLGLLDGHSVADGPKALLAANLVVLGGNRANVGQSNCGGSESKKSGGELHFD